ncbi:MAG: type III-A CRISPR-associated protein Cas10/Csm1 [Chloroflexi bacterium]|nr:type III-A CRISPR-associated protein Cas10/Csm1 [Chloroflexota bacterium]
MQIVDIKYQTVVLAALLHDIGKLLQRGDFGKLDIKGKHPQVSADFVSAYSSVLGKVVDADLLKTLVQHHHESRHFPTDLRVDGVQDPEVRCLASLVSLADNFSASERGERSEQWQDFKFTPLMSVMERVCIPEAPNTAVKDPSLRFRAHPVAGPGQSIFKGVFPEAFDRYADGELNKLITAFGSELASFAGSGVNSFDVLFHHLLHLLYKYAWCLPSNTQEAVPDISLFDHLKTTAAIAACLYHYHTDENSLQEAAIRNPKAARFRLVAGDLSGIQSYIFDIASIGTGGVSRRLRARSLYVQLVTEACAHRILKQFGLPPTNILMLAGGNFYLLLPDYTDAQKILDRVNEEIDRWFLRQLNGEMSLNLASVEFDGNGFAATSEKGEGFGGVLRQVGDRLAAAKQKRFSSALTKGGQWQDTFVIDQDFKGNAACQSCGKFPRQSADEGLCAHCITDWTTGKILPRVSAIGFYSGERQGSLPLPGGSAGLFQHPSEITDAPYLTVRLNHPHLTALHSAPAQSKFIANHIPRVADETERKRLGDTGRKLNIKEQDLPEVGEPITFELLAAQSTGRNYLGFLKMDADNMGAAMIFGLKRDRPESGLDTVSRLATFSRQIEWFFSGWVQHLLSQEEFKYCYTVFSGGDDLFVVGPWNTILDLAGRIRFDYAGYSGNPGLTISAGITIAGSSYPISQAAEDSRLAVKNSKDAGRNRMTVLGHTLTWDDWSTVEKKWKELRERLEPETIGSGFLYSLLEYGRMWSEYRKGNILGLRFQPLLAYNVGRNVKQKESPTFHEWAQSIISLPLEELKQKQVILDNLGLLAQLLLLGKKGGKENE